MTEIEEVKDSQKTVVSFIAGLIVGALLLWMFGGEKTNTTTPDAQNDVNTTTEVVEDEAVEAEDTTPTTNNPEVTTSVEIGKANVTLENRLAGSALSLKAVTFPTDAGWIAVRSYDNNEVGNVLGASRYSKEQGLTPNQIELLSPTIAEKKYAIVFFSENGDRQFNMRTDLPLEVDPIIFTAE